MNTDTIAAIATALSDSGIGIVRISGPEAVEKADLIYKSKKLSSPICFKIIGVFLLDDPIAIFIPFFLSSAATFAA